MRKEAIKPTLRCLLGCNIGESSGLVIGYLVGLDIISTITLSISLAFITGYAFTITSLTKIMTIKSAIKVTLVGDTMSISVMEFTENFLALIIPGFMASFIFEPIFWIGYGIMLTGGFFSAYPVMNYLIKKNKCGCGMVDKK